MLFKIKQSFVGCKLILNHKCVMTFRCFASFDTKFYKADELNTFASMCKNNEASIEKQLLS